MPKHPHQWKGRWQERKVHPLAKDVRNHFWTLNPVYLLRQLSLPRTPKTATSPHTGHSQLCCLRPELLHPTCSSDGKSNPNSAADHGRFMWKSVLEAKFINSSISWECVCQTQPYPNIQLGLQSSGFFLLLISNPAPINRLISPLHPYLPTQRGMLQHRGY